MSRVGKNPVAIPDGVTITQDGDTLKAKGKLGELSFLVSQDVEAVIADNEVTVKPRNKGTRARAMWGTTRSIIENMVQGVSEGFTKTLEIQGVGYKAQVQGKKLVLSLGYSHDIDYPVPEGITIQTPQPTQIDISGADVQKIGQIAAEIRSFRPPEPYKGKGVRYAGEYILRKEGKKK